MKESLLDKIKRLSKDIDKNISPNLSKFEKIKIGCDFIYEKIKYGTDLIDYMQYEFYGKNNIERRKYINHQRLLEIMNICNNPKHRYIFDSKPDFNKNFGPYLGREWVDCNSASEEEFLSFIENKDVMFTKDPKGMFGIGVKKVLLNEIEDKHKLYQDCKEKGLLCEEALDQCKEFAEFNDTTINTLRVVTLKDQNDEVHVMAGVFRIGRKDQVTDNFHNHGLAADINVETGVVYTEGVDRDFVRYSKHPDSNKEINGFKIPKWEEIVKVCKQAAMVIPDVRYVGWDVGVRKDYRIVLIEGNPGADPDVTQIPDRDGKWEKYLPILNGLKETKK